MAKLTNETVETLATAIEDIQEITAEAETTGARGADILEAVANLLKQLHSVSAEAVKSEHAFVARFDSYAGPAILEAADLTRGFAEEDMQEAEMTGEDPDPDFAEEATSPAGWRAPDPIIEDCEDCLDPTREADLVGRICPDCRKDD